MICATQHKNMTNVLMGLLCIILKGFFSVIYLLLIYYTHTCFHPSAKLFFKTLYLQFLNYCTKKEWILAEMLL